MTVERARVSEVLVPDRAAITPDPLVEYTAIGVRSFGKGIFHYEPQPGDKLGSLRFFDVRPGRLVISNIKGWEGAIAVSNKVDDGCVASNRFLQYVPRDDRIDVRWASWFFRSERGIELIQRASPGSADRNRTLAIDRFEALEVPLPLIGEQRRVAARLDRMSESARAASAPFDHIDRRALHRLLPAFVDQAFDAFGPTMARVEDIADFVSDTIHPGDDPGDADVFIGLQHIESHTGQRLGADPIDSMKGRKFRFQPGDVVYGYLRPYLNKVWVADRHGLCSVDQYVLRPHEGVNAHVLACALRGRRSLSTAIELTHSLQLPRLRSGLLAALEVATVDAQAGPRLLERLEALHERVLGLAAARYRQSHLVKAILPAALNEAFGELS